MPDLDSIEPLIDPNMADYHLHCDFSIDAVGSIEDYCLAAMKKGLVEICFTTHYDSAPYITDGDNVIRVNGKLLPATADNLESYVEAVMKADEMFFPLGLAVKLGLEFGYYPGCEEAAEALNARYHFDHFMCGIHDLNKFCFCCNHNYEECFSRYSVEELVDLHCQDIAAVVNSNLFHAIAHLDYIKKFGNKYYKGELDKVLRAKLESDIFPLLAESETSLEVNTSGMRRGLDSYFPRVELVNSARKMGVKVNFLGSDAHKPEEVGDDFDMAAHMIPSQIVDNSG